MLELMNMNMIDSPTKGWKTHRTCKKRAENLKKLVSSPYDWIGRNKLKISKESKELKPKHA